MCHESPLENEQVVLMAQFGITKRAIRGFPAEGQNNTCKYYGGWILWSATLKIPMGVPFVGWYPARGWFKGKPSVNYYRHGVKGNRREDRGTTMNKKSKQHSAGSLLGWYFCLGRGGVISENKDD